VQGSTNYVAETAAVIDDLQGAADAAEQAVEELGAIQQMVAAGDWYGPEPLIHAGYSQQAFDANVLWFMPFWTGPVGVNVDRIGIFVQDGSAGNARLGVYSANPTTARPDELIDDLGTVSVASGGLKSITISETYHGVTPWRTVWLALVQDVAATLLSFGATTGSSVFGGEASNPYAQQAAYFVAHAYGALPSSVNPMNRSIHCPAMYLRKA
jgi:hypothetical protein